MFAVRSKSTIVSQGRRRHVVSATRKGCRLECRWRTSTGLCYLDPAKEVASKTVPIAESMSAGKRTSSSE
jgi:hypothetical protein